MNGEFTSCLTGFGWWYVSPAFPDNPNFCCFPFFVVCLQRRNYLSIFQIALEVPSLKLTAKVLKINGWFRWFIFGFTALIFRGFHSLFVSGWAGGIPSIIPPSLRAPFVERALCPHENHRGGDFRQGADVGCWVGPRVTGRGKAIPGEWVCSYLSRPWVLKGK